VTIPKEKENSKFTTITRSKALVYNMEVEAYSEPEFSGEEGGVNVMMVNEVFNQDPNNF
jgi:hypothetical protein